MELPSYERQNKWLQDYFLPALFLDIGTIAQNYRSNKRESLREKMSKAGVFASLERLESSGTSFEQVMDDMREKIECAERAKRWKDFKFIIPKDIFGAENYFGDNNIIKNGYISPERIKHFRETFNFKFASR